MSYERKSPWARFRDFVRREWCLYQYRRRQRRIERLRRFRF